MALTKTIGFKELGGALLDIAQKEAEEATTRTLVGLNKSKININKTCMHLAKAALAKVASSYVESEIINMTLDVYSGVKVVQAGFTVCKAADEFRKGYESATDDDVAEIERILGLKEVNE